LKRLIKKNKDNLSSLYKYFAQKYPRRSSIPNLFFRQGEADRLDICRQWLSVCEGLKVLDAGCGDGVFISQAISGHCSLLRLEDFIPENIQKASRLLADKTDILESLIIDIWYPKDTMTFDIVISLGVLDYYQDWKKLIQILLSRTKDLLIVDLPKSDSIYIQIREIWLKFNGIKLYSVNAKEIKKYLNDIRYDWELVELPYQWVLKICKGKYSE
jgi:SAM-dependent methyltransferase